MLFETFAIAALPSAAGIYGVWPAASPNAPARSASARRWAIAGSLLAMVVRQGMVPTLTGVAIGVAGAVASSRAINALLFGVSRVDPITYLSVIVLLTGVAAIACGVPAWRAVRVDPATTLRAE